MNLKDYQLAAARTCPDLGSLEANLLHMDLGIYTEIGEILDIFKRNHAYGKAIDVVNLGEEIADVMWYCVNRLRMTNEPLADLLIMKAGKMDSMELFVNLTGYYRAKLSVSWLMNFMNTVANSYKLNIYQLLDTNIAKLKARFPDKFDKDKALNRDLETERKILENGNSQPQ